MGRLPTSGGPRRGAGIADLWNALAELRRKVDYLASAQNVVGRAALAAGRSLVLRDGGSLVIEGGELVLRAADGRALFTIGRMTNSLGQEQSGWVVRRDGDGSTALGMWDVDTTGGTQQALNWFDRNGGVVLADDTNGGAGLARPYVPYSVTSGNDNAETTSGSFVEVLAVAGYRQQPRIGVALTAWADAGTAGEVRLVTGSGTVIAGPTSFGPSGVAPFWVATLPDLAETHMDWEILRIEARRNSGSGSVRVRCFAAMGVQT